MSRTPTCMVIDTAVLSSVLSPIGPIFSDTDFTRPDVWPRQSEVLLWH